MSFISDWARDRGRLTYPWRGLVLLTAILMPAFGCFTARAEDGGWLGKKREVGRAVTVNRLLFSEKPDEGEIVRSLSLKRLFGLDKRRARQEAKLYGMARSADGKRLYLLIRVNRESAFLSEIDPVVLRERRRLKVAEGDVGTPVLRVSQRRILIRYGDNKLVMIRPDTFRIAGRADLDTHWGPQRAPLLASPGSSQVYLVRQRNRRVRFDMLSPMTGEVVRSIKFDGPASEPLKGGINFARPIRGLGNRGIAWCQRGRVFQLLLRRNRIVQGETLARSGVASTAPHRILGPGDRWLKITSDPRRGGRRDQFPDRPALPGTVLFNRDDLDRPAIVFRRIVEGLVFDTKRQLFYGFVERVGLVAFNRHGVPLRSIADRPPAHRALKVPLITHDGRHLLIPGKNTVRWVRLASWFGGDEPAIREPTVSAPNTKRFGDAEKIDFLTTRKLNLNPFYMHRIRWSPDGEAFFVLEKALREPIEAPDDAGEAKIRSLKLSALGLAKTKKSAILRRVRVKDGVETARVRLDHWVADMAVSGRGLLLAVPDRSAIGIFDPETLELRGEIPVPRSDRLVASPRSDLAFAFEVGRSRRAGVDLVNLRDRRPLGHLRKPPSPPKYLGINPAYLRWEGKKLRMSGDGRFIVFAFSSGRVGRCGLTDAALDLADPPAMRANEPMSNLADRYLRFEQASPLRYDWFRNVLRISNDGQYVYAGIYGLSSRESVCEAPPLRSNGLYRFRDLRRGAVGLPRLPDGFQGRHHRTWHGAIDGIGRSIYALHEEGKFFVLGRGGKLLASCKDERLAVPSHTGHPFRFAQRQMVLVRPTGGAMLLSTGRGVRYVEVGPVERKPESGTDKAVAADWLATPRNIRHWRLARDDQPIEWERALESNKVETDGAEALDFGDKHTRVVRMRWADDAGSAVLMLHSDGLLQRIRMRDFTETRRFAFNRRCTDMAMTPEGVAVLLPALDQVWVLDADSLEVRHRLDAPNAAMIAGHKDVPQLVIGTGDHRAEALLSHDFQGGYGTRRITFEAIGQAASEAGKTYSPGDDRPVRFKREKVTDLRLFPEANGPDAFLLAKSMHDEVFRFRVHTRTSAGITWDHGSAGFQNDYPLCVSDDGRYVAVACREDSEPDGWPRLFQGGYFVLRTKALQGPPLVSIPRVHGHPFAFDKADRRFYVFGHKKISIYRANGDASKELTFARMDRGVSALVHPEGGKLWLLHGSRSNVRWYGRPRWLEWEDRP